MKKVKIFFKNLGFWQGVAFAIASTSLISIAATNFPSLVKFTSGTSISSNDINNNFEKIIGTIVFQGNLSESLSLIGSNYQTFPDCLTCNSYRKKISFDTILVSDSDFKSEAPTDVYSSNSAESFNYYEVSSDGWYEIRFISNVNNTVTSPTCVSVGCSYSLNSNITLKMCDNLSSLQDSSYLVSSSKSTSQSDSNSDGSFDNLYNYPGSPPEIKRYYFKAGQIIYAKFESYYSTSNSTITLSSGYPANSANLTIIKL
jgi:hypothetical protein